MKFVLKLSNKRVNNFKINRNSFLNNNPELKHKIYFKNFLSLNKKLKVNSLNKSNNKIKFEKNDNFDVIISGSPKINGKLINSKEIIKIFYKNKNELFYLSGTWVIIIYDNFTENLYVFRDYLGVKPIFFLKSKNEIFLSSNIGLLVENNISNRKLDLNFANIFLHCHPKCSFGREETLFQDIKTFSSTDYMHIDSNFNFHFNKFYNENFFKLENFKNINNKLNIFKNTHRFIKSSLPTKARVATSTSGGIDSAQILYHLKNLGVKKIDSYTAAFGKEFANDETINSKILANKFSNNHNLILIKPKMLIRDLPKLYSNIDVPITTSSMYGFYYLYKNLSKDKQDYIYNGYGGNYTNAGTYPCYMFNFLDIKNKKVLNKEFLNWQSTHNTKLNKKNYKIFKKYINNHFSKILNGKILDKFFYLTNKNLITKKFRKNKFRKNSKIINFGNYLDSYVHYALMYDSSSQASDLEDNLDWMANITTISPLTDKSLIALGFSHDRRNKIHNGINRIKMRKDYINKIPKQILSNPNTEGFKLPFNIWINKELKSFLMKTISSKKFSQVKIFNKKNIKKIFKEHFDEKKDNSMIIWIIINFYFWVLRWKPKI